MAIFRTQIAILKFYSGQLLPVGPRKFYIHSETPSAPLAAESWITLSRLLFGPSWRALRAQLKPACISMKNNFEQVEDVLGHAITYVCSLDPLDYL